MKAHWKILIWMILGVLVGGFLQLFLEAPLAVGLVLEKQGDSILIQKVDKAAKKAGLAPGMRIDAVILRRGRKGEKTVPLQEPKDFFAVLPEGKLGDVVFLRVREGTKTDLKPLTLEMAEDAPRRVWIQPFRYGAQLFMALLKMLIVPLVLTSIISGVAGVGATRDLKRLGAKTLGYYLMTSLFAILTGLFLVNILRPGVGAELGLPYQEARAVGRSFWDILLRMVPENLFVALGDNGRMLQIIFFGLLFGAAITIAPEPHRGRVRDFFQSAFEIMMKLAEMILKLVPYGVFCLLVKVVGETGFGLFKPLALYMGMIVFGLAFHGLIVLPFLLQFMGRIRPLAWAKAMAPALMTAFSSSSSSMTLPVTLECVEKRGGVSNKVSSFVLPLGATINMDGTALYECAGVIFLSQYYASIGGVSLSLGQQVFVVVMALFASIGAAGIPSAGLVMMVTILSALKLPVEGAALLLAVDRPLDMLRTVINVWSDSCGSALIAKSEGEAVLANLDSRSG